MCVEVDESNVCNLNVFFTALFFTFNKEGVENVFQLHYSQCKIDTTSVYSLPLSSKVEKAIVNKSIRSSQ